MEQIVLVLAYMVVALLNFFQPVSAQLTDGPYIVDPEGKLAVAAVIAMDALETEGCKKFFTKRYDVSDPVALFRTVKITVLDIPDHLSTGGDKGSYIRGLCICPLAIDTFSLDVFWLTMQGDLSNAMTLVHEFAHIADCQSSKIGLLSEYVMEKRADAAVLACFGEEVR